MGVNPKFLGEEDVVELHRQLISRHGGAFGILDPGLLDSAIHAPQASWGGEYLYRSLSEMAAAYWHGLAKNHSFIDGNKRVALAAASQFLRMNGWRLTFNALAAIQITVQIAENEITREQLAAMIESNMEALPLVDQSKVVELVEMNEPVVPAEDPG